MNFIQQGFRGKTDWWMYLLTVFLIFVAIQIAAIPLMIMGYVAVDGDMVKFQKGAYDNFINVGIDKNLYLFLMIFTFMVGLWMLYICVKQIHKKKFKWIVTSRQKIDWKRFWFAFLVWAIISVITIYLGVVSTPEDYIWNFKPIPFFTLLLVSVLFLPFQTSAEELIFRGYLMQGIGILAKNKWLPLLVTSITFGLLHTMNPEVDKLGNIAMVFYIGTGLLYGIVTLMDEGTELALGLHAANNIVAAFFVTTDWMVFQTDALYIDTSEPSVGWEMFFPVLVLYPLVLIIFSKKYGWKNWKEKLLGKVDKPVILSENDTLNA